MKKIAIYAVLILALVNNCLAAPRVVGRKVNCPVIGNLKTGEATKSALYYICYTTQAAALKEGFIKPHPSSTPTPSPSGGSASSSSICTPPYQQGFELETNAESISPAFIVSDPSHPGKIFIKYRGRRSYSVALYNADTNRLISVVARGNTDSDTPIFVNYVGRYFLKIKIYTIGTLPSGTLVATVSFP